MRGASPQRAINILLVEDNPDDVFLMRRALDQSALRKRLHVVGRGEDALRFLHREAPFEEAPRPMLVLLDLRLPDISGIEVLRRMNSDDGLRPIPVIMLTVSQNPDDLLAAYDERVRAFVIKPSSREEFDHMVARIEAFWLETAQLPSD